MKQLLFFAIVIFLTACDKSSSPHAIVGPQSSDEGLLQRDASINFTPVTSQATYVNGDTVLLPNGKRGIICEVFSSPTVFYGSSSLSEAFWKTLEADFAEFNPIRKAYPGKTVGHLLLFEDTAIAPLGAKQIVNSCGENDIYDAVVVRKINFTVGDMLYRVRSVINKERLHNPNATITWLEIKKTPKLQPAWAFIDEVNAGIKAHIARTPNASFIPVNHALVASDYRGGSDGIHLTVAGTQKLKNLILPYLIK